MTKSFLFYFLSFRGSGALMANGDFQSWQETVKSFPPLFRDRQNYALPVYHAWKDINLREMGRGKYVYQYLLRQKVICIVGIFKNTLHTIFSLIKINCSTVTYYIISNSKGQFKNIHYICSTVSMFACCMSSGMNASNKIHTYCAWVDKLSTLCAYSMCRLQKEKEAKDR